MRAARCVSSMQQGPVTRTSRSPTVSRPRRRETGGRDCINPLDAFEVSGKLFGGAVGFVDQESPSDPAIIFDGFENLLLGLSTHSGQSLQLGFFSKLLDSSQVTHLKSAPDQIGRAPCR